MKILIIGGGNMGLTYAVSFLKGKIVEKEQLMILERTAERAKILESMEVGTIYNNPEDCLPKADLVILAVKPQDCKSLFQSLRPLCETEQIFLSIMAGVTIETIQQGLGVNKIIRSMPNLPAQVGMGMTAFTSSDEVTRIELITVQNLLNTTGKAIYIEKEEMIDAATAISGSGPAYVYYFMNSLIDAAVQMGFSFSEAQLLVGQTFMGAVHLQNRNKLSCEEWIQKVASKGGTTEAALKVFDNESVKEGIKSAAASALNRAIELSKA